MKRDEDERGEGEGEGEATNSGSDGGLARYLFILGEGERVHELVSRRVLWWRSRDVRGHGFWRGMK